MAQEPAPSVVELATELTIAWLGNHNNRLAAEDVPDFLASMFQTVTRLAGAATAPATPVDVGGKPTPAVSVRRSLASRDHIVSMIDGKPYKTLRRHLAANGLTPEEYRSRYGLRSDYPMTATSYTEARRAMAKSIGLGRKRKQADEDTSTPLKTPAPAPADVRPSGRRILKAKT